MKKFMSIIVSVLILIGFVVSTSGVFADTGYDGFIKVKLTSPLKSERQVRLYSESGFSLVRMNNLDDEVEFLKVDEIYATVGEEGEVLLLDSDGEIVYIFEIDDQLVITSKDGKEVKVKVENLYYRGYITFNVIRDKLYVINYLSLEEYLYGVLPKEMGYSFHIEALKAQAVAARTYAIKSLNKHIEEGYNLCDSEDCQSYGGYNVESTKINEAIDETEGMIITYNGYPIEAVYHSNSGGHTEDAKEAWGGNVPYLIGIADDFSRAFPNSSWQLNITSEEIGNKLYNNGIDVGKVLDIIILDTSSAGRVGELLVIGIDGEEIISSSKFRTILGTATLKSTLFTIEKENIYDGEVKIYFIDEDEKIKTMDLDNINVIDGDENISSVNNIKYIITDRGVEPMEMDTTPMTVNFNISGNGYGHGVGMSQWGAQGMAINGYDYEEILKYYYKGVDIEFKE